MEMTTKEVHSISNNNRDTKSISVNSDCTWNSRGCKAIEGVVAAIAQKNGRIIYIVRKTTYRRECQKKQKLRDENKMTAT